MKTAMNPEYTPTTFRLRVLLATASIILSTTLLGMVVGLADHYSQQMPLAAADQPVAVALN